MKSSHNSSNKKLEGVIRLMFYGGSAFLLGVIFGHLQLSKSSNEEKAFKGSIQHKQDNIGEESNTLPVRIGARRIAVQFDSLLPQVHLTLVSILQGIALGVLMESVNFKTFKFHLFPLYVASVIVVALIWHLYANAFVAFIWPFAGWHTLLQFLLAVVEIFAFAEISEPGIWMIGLALTSVIGALIRWLNTRIVSEENYVSKSDYMLDKKIEKTAAIRMVVISFIVMVVGIIRYLGGIEGYQYLELFDVVTGSSIAIVVFWMLHQTDRDTAMLLKSIFSGSPWEYKNNHILNRKN